MSVTPLSTTPLLALALSVILHLAVLKLFPRWGLLDSPGKYGLSRPPLPYPAGIASVTAFLVIFPFLGDKTAPAIALFFSVILLGITCFIDDRTSLHPLLRLSVQILIGLILFVAGVRIYSLTNPLDAITGSEVISLDSFVINTSFAGSLPIMSGVFTIVWILLTTNALNWFDGIPGQVSTLSTLGFLTIGLLALSDRVDQADIAIISLTLAGISLGSLFFDFPPNRVVTGDTGSMFFGLLLGVLTIYSGGKVATAFLVLGVPLIDSFFVIARRIARGQSPLRGNASDQHLHHRLIRKGWSERQVIILTAALGASFGITALFLDTLGKVIAAAVLFIVMLGLSVYSRPDGQPIDPTQGKKARPA